MCILSPIVDAAQDSEPAGKTGGLPSFDEQDEVPPALQSLVRKGVIKQKDNEFYALLGDSEVRTWIEESFDFDDCAGLQAHLGHKINGNKIHDDEKNDKVQCDQNR